MNVIEKYNNELLKFSGLKQSSEKKFLFSDVLLFREYQSRLYKWKLALDFDGDDFFLKRKSYHNLFVDLNPSWFKDLIAEEIIVKDLNAKGLDFILSALKEFMGYFMFLYINWEIFKEREEIKKYALSDPYESLFIILRRGGLIYFSGNMFNINGRTYLKYDNNFRLPSIEIYFLDFIDAHCLDFPNQEEVNLLWTQYSLK